MHEPTSPRSPLSLSLHSPCSELLTERIYKICSEVHVGMRMDQDAAGHIRELLDRVLFELLHQKPSVMPDLERQAAQLFSAQQTRMINMEWSDLMQQFGTRRPFRISFGAKTLQLQQRLVVLIKEYLCIREKEKKEREKELERMAIYLLAVVDHITEDVLKWTGDYVMNIRDADMCISLQNLKIALSADKTLMQLAELLQKTDDDSSAPSGGLLGGFIFDFDLNEPLTATAAVSTPKRMGSYQETCTQMLTDERQYMRDLNLLVNVFRRKFDSALAPEDKGYLDQIFGDVVELHELTMKMERTLEDSRELADQHCLGVGFWELAEAHEFDVYQQYIEHISTSCSGAAIAKVLSEKKYSDYFENEARNYVGTSSSAAFKLSVKYVLPILLEAPVFHFFRYVEYCSRLSMLSESDEDRTDLQNTRTYLAGVAAKIEKALDSCTPPMKKRLKQEQATRAANAETGTVERILEIEKNLEGYTDEPIARTCRQLIKEGDLTMVRPSMSVLTTETVRRRWSTERHVYVFDHLLILCKMHKNICKFKDRLSIRTVEVHDLEDTEVVQNAFRIESRERRLGGRGRGEENYRSIKYTFVCKSAEEKVAWMEAVVSIQSRSLLDRMLDGYLKEERKRIPLVVPTVDQYIFAEPDTDENIVFEDYTSSSGIPVVKHGTLVKLVERLTYHLYTDNAYVRTFLISYRSFCMPSRLLNLLIQRFEVPIPSKLLVHQPEMRGGPLAGRYDTVQSHGLSGGTSGASCAASAGGIGIAAAAFFNSAFLEQSYQRFRKEYEAPIQLKVLNVMRKWVSDHWYDFDADSDLLSALLDFLQRLTEAQRSSNQHRKFAKNIISVIKKKKQQCGSADNGHSNSAFSFDDDTVAAAATAARAAVQVGTSDINSFQPKKPDTVWHAAKKGDVANYDLLTLHPLEIGRQLTLLHFDLYRAIKPVELVGAAWMKNDKYKRSPQLLKLTNHSTLLSYWISRSIVETDSLDERVAVFARVIEVMMVFEELHNFTGLVAFYSALNQACIHRLTWCWDRLDNEKQKCYDRFKSLCGVHWEEMMKRLSTINPPVVPFFVPCTFTQARISCHYLTTIHFFEKGNVTLVNAPGVELLHEEDGSQKRVLISFLKCRRIANVITEIQMWQNEPYALQVEPSIRQFFESINPTGDFDENSDALESYLYDRSLKIQPKDQDKPAYEAKPRHPPHVMRSPGIRPPKQQQQHHERGMSFASSFTSFGSSSGAPGGASSATLTPGNTYTPGAQTAPPTPSYDQDGAGHRSARQPVLHQSSQEDTQSAGHFTLSDIPRGAREHGKEARQTQRAGMVPPPAVSLGHSPTPPPPLQPRKVSRAAGLPMGNAPPPLYPRRATKAGVAAPAQATSPTSTPSPATTSPATAAKSPDDHHQPSRPALETPAASGLLTSPSTSSSQPSSATSAAAAPPPSFFFPSSPPLPSNTSSMVSPPAIPPRRPASTLSTPHPNSTNSEAIASPTSNAALTSNGTESLRVVLERPPSGSPPEAVSPTVSLSVPLPPSSTSNPPALPPRRSALQQQPPPPLPPKPGQHQQLSPGASLSPPPPPLPAPPGAGSPTDSTASAAPAPPIPPKTYKQRKHSPTTR